MPYTTQLAWLVTMAGNPGFKAYAWSRAKELDADPSELWRGIAKALESAMVGPARDSGSAPPGPTKPRSRAPKSGTQAGG